MEKGWGCSWCTSGEALHLRVEILTERGPYAGGYWRVRVVETHKGQQSTTHIGFGRVC